MGHILLGIPSSGGQLNSDLFMALITETMQKKAPPLRIVEIRSSATAFGFNQLWCIALNNRDVLSHFLMLHTDVVPSDPGFVQTMLDEMERVGADVLSAVIPLKSETGITSTALAPDMGRVHVLGERGTRRRLTMAEIAALPETFNAFDVVDAQQCAYRSPVLLVNTGLLLVDLRKPWVERVHFTLNDKLWQREDGKFVCDFEPEDWFFAARAA